MNEGEMILSDHDRIYPGEKKAVGYCINPHIADNAEITGL